MMTTKSLKLLSLIAFSIIGYNTVLRGMTTLQHFDPAPIFSANDSMVPPNSQFLDLFQARIKKEKPNKARHFGLNVTGFLQRSVRANGYNSSTQYGTVSGSAPNAFEMGDFRGTMYPMGLFLGSNPNTGNNIWVNNTDDGNPLHVTGQSIANFGLPSCLENIAYSLAGYDPENPATPNATMASSTAVIFYPASITTVPEDGPLPGKSLFSEEYLALDTVYFGAFSLPIVYQKQGLRWELNIDIADHFGLTFQGGMVSMSQQYVNNYTTSSTTGLNTYGPYSISALNSTASTPVPLSPLYEDLNLLGSSGTPPPTGAATTPVASPDPEAQQTFNDNICNNINEILNNNCLYSTPLCGFNDYSVEDLRVILTFKGSYAPFRYRHGDDEDLEDDVWSDMIFTPYAWIGATAPIAKPICYQNILSLPFGNNGHASLGGAIGMTFDFVESVEVGVEGGVTAFLAQDEYRPFPTHQLQRVIYPFETYVRTQPGMNWHFKALLNAYQFINHINFWMTYEIVEHRHDCFEVLNASQAQYFVPEVITCRSDWRAQFFNAALVFDIQPGLQASVVWQQPISPRNAYYPVGIFGSLNFMF